MCLVPHNYDTSDSSKTWSIDSDGCVKIPYTINKQAQQKDIG